MKSLKYTNYDITFQEVPNETTLVFNISNCPHHCKGCHSQYLWEDVGEYLLKDMSEIIFKYKDYITCVCLMGGDYNIEELEYCFKIIKEFNLKTCVYSGLDDISYFKPIFQILDYIKIGHFDIEKGGLDKFTTNQMFYKFEENLIIDITNSFRKD